MVTTMATLLWSEGYCYFLYFLLIAYYPVTNRFNCENAGPRFGNSTIDKLGITQAGEMTCLSKQQRDDVLQQATAQSIESTSLHLTARQQNYAL